MFSTPLQRKKLRRRDDWWKHPHRLQDLQDESMARERQKQADDFLKKKYEEDADELTLIYISDSNIHSVFFKKSISAMQKIRRKYMICN